VVTVVEVKDKNLGTIRFWIIPDASGERLISCIKNNTSHNSVIITDGWLSYAPLQKEN
jgi:hypothetical protein